MLPKKLPLKNIKRPRIITVTSGKGGVGKSTFSLIAAIELAKEFNVLLVSANNCGDYFELLRPETGDPVANFYITPNNVFNLVRQTLIKNLGLLKISDIYPHKGARLIWEKHLFFKSLRNIPVDFIIVDLGLANNYKVINLFIEGDETLVLTQHDPFSMSRTRQLLMTCYLQRFQKSFKYSPEICNKIENYLKNIWLNGDDMKSLLKNDTSIPDVMKLLIDKHIAFFQPKLLFNFVDVNGPVDEIGILQKDINILQQYCEIWGHIRYDQSVRSIFREAHIFKLDQLNSPAVMDMKKIIDGMIKKTDYSNSKKSEEVEKHPDWIKCNKPRPVIMKNQQSNSSRTQQFENIASSKGPLHVMRKAAS